MRNQLKASLWLLVAVATLVAAPASAVNCKCQAYTAKEKLFVSKYETSRPSDTFYFIGTGDCNSPPKHYIYAKVGHRNLGFENGLWSGAHFYTTYSYDRLNGANHNGQPISLACENRNPTEPGTEHVKRAVIRVKAAGADH
jgi:hypothetical protein